MTDTAETAEQPLRQLDRELAAEAKRLGIAYQVYLEMTPRERSAKKMSHAHKIRAEAKRRGIDADEFLALDDAGRDRVRQDYPERPKKPKASETLPSPANEPASYIDEGLTDGDDEDEETETFSPHGAVPATEADPAMRQKPTLGEVTPTENEDRVGRAPPKNLLDVYRNYTIGDGQHFIRVERLEPRVYQQIRCNGHLGEIREPISEDHFRLAYGGSIYELTVYGPDPKGRKDPITGLPMIKRKTEPFRYTVPRYPPNLMMMPGMSPSARQASQGESPMTQSFMFPQPGLPMTTADAAAQKSTLDFLGQMIKRSDERIDRAQQQNANGHGADVLKVVSDASKSAIEQANAAANARETSLLSQLADEREGRRRIETELADVRRQIADNRGGSMKEATEFIKEVNPARTVQEQIGSIKAQHADELARLNQSHKDVSAALKERHDDELRRNRERMDELERSYKLRLEDAERRMKERDEEASRRAADREREHRDQVEQIRREEKQRADERLGQLEQQYKDRVADLKDRHAGELRMQTEQHSTRLETQKSTLDYQLTSTKERLKRAEEERDEAREEAERAKNPVEVLEQAKAQAEALGYEKADDNGPKTAGERFAATAGVGLAKALETMGDWLPKLGESLAQARSGVPLGGPPGAPQRALGQAPGAPGRPRRPNPRTVAWATENSIPITGAQPIEPPRRAERPEPAPAPTPAEPPPAAAAPGPPGPATAVPESMAHQPAPAEAAPPAAPAPPTNPLLQMFPPEAAMQFKNEIERSITAGMDAETFAKGMMREVPDAARAMVSYARPEHLAEAVRSMPNSLESPILRRDGKRWVEDLWKHLALLAKEPAQAAS